MVSVKKSIPTITKKKNKAIGVNKQKKKASKITKVKQGTDLQIERQMKNVPKLKAIEAVPKKKKASKTTKDILRTNNQIKESHTKNVCKVEAIPKKTKYKMPSKKITAELVDSSLNALQQLSVHYKKKNSIFEDEIAIFAEIRCIKIQSSKTNVRCVLPYSIVASTGEVCLITPDLKKGKKIDHEPTIDHWNELLRKANVTAVKTILPMRQLLVEYDQFEMKRRLQTQHDFIMVDTRVLSHATHCLGKMFNKRSNMLIPVRINEVSLKRSIDIGLRTVMLRLSEGATSSVLVGHTGMPQEHVKENILALVQQLKDRFPGRENNIRQIALKFPLSLSLPLYLTLRPNHTVSAPKIKRKKPKNFATIEGELSTIPGSTVRVAPDGTVHVKRGKATDISDMEAEQDADDQSI